MTKSREHMNEQELRDALALCESELAAAQKADTAKTEFLAMMSHEIRTPMNAVIGIAHILKSSNPLTDRQRECVETLKTSADGLMALINDLLDVAKIENGALDLETIPFDLNKLLRDVISILKPRATERNVTLQLEAGALEERMVVGDPTRMRQIVLNLCSNAVKFTEHGRIDCVVECMKMMPGSETIVIRVRDTGIGIAPDKLESIFAKFSQADSSISRKYGGTGLGLAITKMLTEAMGGTIAVTSELGKGSEFSVTFTLPVLAVAKQA